MSNLKGDDMMMFIILRSVFFQTFRQHLHWLGQQVHVIMLQPARTSACIWRVPRNWRDERTGRPNGWRRESVKRTRRRGVEGGRRDRRLGWGRWGWRLNILIFPYFFPRMRYYSMRSCSYRWNVIYSGVHSCVGHRRGRVEIFDTPIIVFKAFYSFFNKK